MRSAAVPCERHVLAAVGASDVIDRPAALPDIAISGRDTNSVRPFGRPRWRGRMHSWAFIAAIPAGALLTASAGSALSRVAAAIYASTLVLLFGTSAAYHRLTRTERTRSIMQRVDHSMIYLLIAGTYTPFCLVALPIHVGLPLLGFIVLMAAAGIAMKVLAFDRARRWSYALYPAMGWAVFVAGPALMRSLSGTQLALIAIGGVTYSIGIPVLVSKRPDPLPAIFGYHEIWHALTIAAAGAHFVAIRGVVA